MRALQSIIVGLLALSTTAVAKPGQSVTVYTWPVDSTKPQQLAQITYDAESLSTTVDKYTPPAAPYKIDDKIRVGLYDVKTHTWRGIVTSAASFDPAYQHKLSLQMDDAGEVYHVGFDAFAKPSIKKSKTKSKNKSKQKGGRKGDGEPVAAEGLQVELLKPATAPSPHLNKPIVLDPTGKVADEKQDKSFLQKYWWAIALFLAVQVLMPGGKE